MSDESATTPRIAFSNQKGGVGKTTVAINTAGALAERGHDVLFVDVDPQGNATEGLGLGERYDDAEPNLYTALSDISEAERINDIVEVGDEFDVVPSNLDMFSVEAELPTEMRSRDRLTLALDALDAEYDFILVDCPPNLGVLTDNALLACENIVIPALAESTSKRALSILYRQIQSLEDAFETRIHERALVANRVENDGQATETMDWFEDAFGEHIEIFEVRKRVALKRAWDDGVSTFAHEEECDMSTEFEKIAEHLEVMFE